MVMVALGAFVFAGLAVGFGALTRADWQRLRGRA